MKNLFRLYWHMLLIVFFLPIVFIFCVFKEYGADDNTIISITTAAFAYYGTVILATVTLLQNEKITEINKRSADIEEVRLSNQYHPLIEFDSILNSNQQKCKLYRLIKQDVDLYQADCTDNLVSIVITNNGNASAYDVTYYDFSLIIENDGKISNEIKYDYRERKCVELKPNESLCLEYHICNNTIFEISFNILYHNEYGQFFYSPMVVNVGGDEKRLYVQCGVGRQENGKSQMNVKEWYYQI